MNKKRLPRAILRRIDEEGELALTGPALGPSPKPASEPGTLASAFAAEPKHPAGDVVVQMRQPPESRRAEDKSGDAALTVDAARRRSRALALVDRHAAMSAIGGIIPLPIANFAGVGAVILRMVKALSGHYSVPFERDRARAIVVALIGGAMPAGVGTLTASALFYILPPSALLGLAASSITAATFTRSVGRIFVEHFETGATWKDFTPPDRPSGVLR
jgi:uncharacterized protein (DUF697 family)